MVQVNNDNNDDKFVFTATDALICVLMSVPIMVVMTFLERNSLFWYRFALGAVSYVAAYGLYVFFGQLNSLYHDIFDDEDDEEDGF